MRLLLLLPDGVGIRNFVISQFPEALQRADFDHITVWHTLPEEQLAFFCRNWSVETHWKTLANHHEGLLPYLLRRGKNIAQLYAQAKLFPKTNVLLNQLATNRKRSIQLGNWIADRLGHLFSFSLKGSYLLDQWHEKAVSATRYEHVYETLLSEEKPDVVFCSHQRSEMAVPVMVAARRLGIPTATFIYSWDNLPKGRMAVHSDYYLVWSEYMRDEMRCYYPEVSSDRVIIVGTPQFENYFKLSLIELRSDFFKRLGLNPLRPVICFSGDDLITSPYDPQYLEDLAEELRNIPEINRPQIIFRRCPVDITHRYDSVLKKYPEIIESRPAWIPLLGEDWSKMIPTEEDMWLLVNIVRHCDLVVNLGSTMGLDFAILDKPAVFVAYQPQGWHPDCHWNFNNVYSLPHFETVHRLQPVYWARSKEELIVTVLQALEYPDEKRASRDEWIQTITRVPLDQASQRCAEALQMIKSHRHKNSN